MNTENESISSGYASCESSTGDKAENIRDNPRSWCAWKREAERFEALLLELEHRLREEEEAHVALQSRCYEGFASATDGIFDHLREAEKDAKRYRWLRDESDCLSYTSDTGPQPSTPESRMLYAINSAGKRNTDMIEIRLLCYHLGPHDEPIWKDEEHFDYAANMDASIDAAMAREIPS